eukprot:6815531-Pyramimonas_sp.AAC.1
MPLFEAFHEHAGGADAGGDRETRDTAVLRLRRQRLLWGRALRARVLGESATAVGLDPAPPPRPKRPRPD